MKYALLLAVLLASQDPDPAAALAATLSSPEGWELKPVPGAEGLPAEACDAKSVDTRELEDGGRKVRGLFFGALGKSSHMCDGAAQVSKIVEFPGPVRLKLRLVTVQWDSAPAPRLALRLVDPATGRTLFRREIGTAARNKMERPEDRDFLFHAKAGTKVRVVFDTTCRTVTWFAGISAASYRGLALDDAGRKDLGALLDAFRADDAGTREAASGRLGDWIRKPGLEAALRDFLRGERERREDAESRARIDAALARPELGAEF